jgi:hypothetical protein
LKVKQIFDPHQNAWLVVALLRDRLDFFGNCLLRSTWKLPISIG